MSQLCVMEKLVLSIARAKKGTPSSNGQAVCSFWQRAL